MFTFRVVTIRLRAEERMTISANTMEAKRQRKYRIKGLKIKPANLQLIIKSVSEIKTSLDKQK